MSKCTVIRSKLFSDFCDGPIYAFHSLFSNAGGSLIHKPNEYSQNVVRSSQNIARMQSLVVIGSRWQSLVVIGSYWWSLVVIALCSKSNGRCDIKAEKEKNQKVKVVINQIFGRLQHPKNEVRYLQNIFSDFRSDFSL